MKNQTMYQKVKKLLFKPYFIAFFFALVFIPARTEAVTPSLSVYSTSNNVVQMTVQGDPNAQINLYYYQLGSNLLSNPVNIGTTNSSGYFSTSVAQGTYGIPGGTTVYVTVNGQQSSNVVWPNTFSSGSNVYLSQSSVTVSQGQSQTINIYGGTGSYSINSNSNSSVASVTVSGNLLQIYGSVPGTTTVNVCATNSTSNCASIVITVSGTYYGSGSLTVSQSSVYLSQGQSQTVTLYGGGNYYLTNNPNTNIATATITGNQLIIYGINPGSVSYSVCSGSGTYSCAAIYVNVTTYYYDNSTSYYPNNYNSGFTTNAYPYYTYNSYGTYAYPTTYTTTYTQPTYVQPTYSYAAQAGTPVSGVFLSQVPATGISFGLKVTLFVFGLVLWSIFGAYVLSKKEHTIVSGAKDKAGLFKEIQMKKKGF